MHAEQPLAGGERLIQRICGEFLEMPGLQLTLRQAQRLWALDGETCAQVMSILVDLGFLRRVGADGFARADGGPAPAEAGRSVGVPIDGRHPRGRRAVA